MQDWNAYFSQLGLEEKPIRYGIAITPRSGSTWFGDILTRTDSLGKLGEYFNREAAENTIRFSGARDIPGYFDYLTRAYQTHGVFGFEIDWLRLKQLIDEGYEEIFAELRAWLFLRRRDFVSQSVSLFKARASGYWHSHQSANEAKPVEYNESEILNGVLMLINSEYHLSRYFERLSVTPLELWYEDVVKMTPVALGTQVLNYLNIEITDVIQHRLDRVEPRFTKIGSAQNAEFAERFRAAHKILIEVCERERGNISAAELRLKFPEYAH